MEGVDRINELTDEMLVTNIMSRLNCTTKELIRTTATISKRWKNLWALVPHLIFLELIDVRDCVVKKTDLRGLFYFIDNTLNKCPTDLNLKKFKFDCNYSSLVNVDFKSRANSWIRYAITRNVEEVHLSLWDVGVVGQGWFTFEDELFFNTSCITRMSMCICRFNPPNGAISWERLECLRLFCVILDEDIIEKILSGSPCLESLVLIGCYGYRRIDVTSKSVKKLVFDGHYPDGKYSCVKSYEEDYIDCIKINALYISLLTIKGEFILRELALLDVSSLIKVDLDYSLNLMFYEKPHEEIFRGLLESLDHVKDVTINDYCWKLYSRLEARGVTSNRTWKHLVWINNSLAPLSRALVISSVVYETLTALLDPESDKWLSAMNVEMQSMKDNEVWDLVDLPPNGKTVGSKWLFKKKTDMDGAVHTYKAHLVAKGYTQTPGIDYEETFSPVADIRAIRILIAIAAFYDYEIWQIDVKTAFLNGYLSEEVYMEQPEGFVNLKYPNRVCKLKRSIYGLKQASRQWNKRFDDEIKKFGFTQNHDEPCVYLKASGSNVTFLILYVDDILIMGNNIPMLQDVKSYIGRCFAMKDLGEAAYILGIKIYRDRSRRLIGFCQSAYIEKILKRYHMENSKRRSIPMQEKLRLSKSQGDSTPAELKRMQNVAYALAMGSIMYDVRCTRPDVAFAQNITSRFQHNPCDLHWTTLRPSCYTGAGYLTDADDLKSQTGYVFVLNGGAVDWNSAKQSIFATSSVEAEYIAAYDASKEAVWVRKFISGLGVVPTIEEPINMYCDNTGAITIANESGITKGARHFRAKVHYLREVIEFGDIKLEKVHTYDNLADPFTKALAFPKHSEHTKNIGMLPASSLM
ncbi:retrotransposon protein, putative, ty1-copia subclass [Tanacetum coccineum]